MKPIVYNEIKEDLKKALEEKMTADKDKNEWNILPDLAYFQVFSGEEKEGENARLLGVVFAMNSVTAELRMFNLADLVPSIIKQEAPTADAIAEGEIVAEA